MLAAARGGPAARAAGAGLAPGGGAARGAEQVRDVLGGREIVAGGFRGAAVALRCIAVGLRAGQLREKRAWHKDPESMELPRPPSPCAGRAHGAQIWAAARRSARLLSLPRRLALATAQMVPLCGDKQQL